MRPGRSNARFHDARDLYLAGSDSGKRGGPAFFLDNDEVSV